MARQGVTEQQVIEAAEGLAANGQPVTVSAVREALGGTGSYSTINPLLAKWREASGGQRSGGDVPDMPEPVGRAARAFWGAAWKEAQDGIKGDREALDAARRDMARERQDMTGEILRLEAENARQAEELERRGAALDQAEAARRAAEEAANGLRVDNARLDERAKAAEGTADTLRADNARLEERTKTAETRADTLETERRGLAGEVNRLEADNARQAQEVERFRHASGKAEAEREREETARIQAEASAQVLQVENARLLERATGAESHGAGLQGELDKLHARFQEVAAKVTPTAPAPAPAPRARKKPEEKPANT